MTPAATLAEIDRLLDPYTEAQVAVELKARGYQTFAGLPFRTMHVSDLRRAHGLKARYTHLRGAGMLADDELAARLGVTPQTIWRWYHRHRIEGARYNDRGTCLFLSSAVVPPQQRAGRAQTRR